MKSKSIYRENIYNIDEVSKLRNYIEGKIITILS